MATPSTGPSSEIYPSMELEDVFLHFLKRFETLPSPRSVAEAGITTDEFEALKLWFSERWGMPRMWCEDPFQITLANQVLASRQEMFGALLLILASEVCRTSSNEDSVWPAVTAVLKADTKSFPALFVAGQPTTACKNALAAGSRRLKLRNLIDRYGAQEYFDTLKLQFGFTRGGAVRKLPQWLDGNAPIAVRILTGDEPEYGDLRSSSFTELWKALQDFRRSRVSSEYTSVLLQASPWIRPEWTAELMRAATLRLPRLQTLLDAQEGLDRSNEAVCGMLLRWEYPSKPELSLQLNEEQIYEILGEAETAIFAVDGRVVDRWTAQETGGWRGKRNLPCQPPGAKTNNLLPKLLSISSEGKLLKEIDLSEMGMGEPLLIFDLKLGTPVNLASRLDLSRDYALICDTDLSVPDATPYLKLKDRAAYRLASPWPQDLRVVCDDVLYWQPRIEQREPFQPIRLTLESLPGEIGEVGSACRVNVAGVPEDATVVSLIAGGASHLMAQKDIYWQTSRPLQITLGIALGEERIRIRVSGPSYVRAVTPKVSLNLRGIACFEAESNADAEPKWTLLNRHRPLNRVDGSGRARVFVEYTNSQLFEGSRFVGKVSPRGLQLRDLCGWGAPLIVRSEHQSDTMLVEAVDDYGRGRFLPPLFKGQTGACLSWRTPMPPSNGHQVLVWSDLSQEPQRFGGNQLCSQKDDTLWKLPGLGSVAAMAVAYKGVRSASYWVTEPIINALRNARSPAQFALFRWLKLPILNSSLRVSMQEAVGQAPAEFVSGWLGAAALPCGLVHRPAEDGLDAVIREFLWNHTDRNETRMERLARAFPSEVTAQSEGETFKSLLSRLGEICPSLSYRLAAHKLRSDKYRKYVRAVVAAMLHEPADCPQLRDTLTAACRDCANLIGIPPEALQANVDAFGAHLDNQASNYKEVEPDLRRLGETSRGRKFLSAWLLLRLVERSRF